jgi:hypothetical protein
VRQYEELMEYRGGFRAYVTFVDYKDKKGKLIERFTLYVKWVD